MIEALAISKQEIKVNSFDLLHVLCILRIHMFFLRVVYLLFL